MKKIEDYTPEELVSYSALIGILISRKFNIIQRFFRASILSGIARSIIITVNQERLISNSEILDTNLDSTDNDLEKQLKELKKRLEKLMNDRNN